MTRTIAFVLICVSTTAMAQESETDVESEARREFEAGREAYSEGRFEAALAHYERAHALSARSELIYNIANTHDRLGHRRAALEGYRVFIRQMPNARNADFVRNRIARLQAEEAEEAEEAQEAETEPEQAEQIEQPVPTSSSRGATIGLWVLAGAAGVAGIATGARSYGVRSSIEDDCVDGTCPGERREDADTMRALAISTDVLLAASLVSFTVGLILLLTGNDDDSSVACRGTECGVAIEF